VNKDVHKKVGTAKKTRIHGLSDDRENMHASGFSCLTCLTPRHDKIKPQKLLISVHTFDAP